MKKSIILSILFCLIILSGAKFNDETISWGLSHKGEGKLPQIPNSSEQMLSKNNGLYLANDKKVYFTFDLGYEAGYTNEVLDILNAHNIKAVFFLCGNYLKETQLINRMIDEGHVIGNHTDKHKDLPTLSEEKIQKDISDFKEKFDNLNLNTQINLFRPPQGRFNEKVLKIASNNGLKTVLWSVAIVDWNKKEIDAKASADKVMSKMHEGAIMLFHIANAGMPKMLNNLIPNLKEKGYEIGNAHELNTPIIKQTNISLIQEEIDLPVIMYHCVLKSKSGKYVVTPQRLEQDFIYLKENGYTSIFIQDLIDYQNGVKSLPKKPVMITFDDGNKTAFINVFPLMKKHNMKCVFSVVGSYIDSNYDINGNLKGGYAYLNYEHIKQMQQSGLAEFQNHSYDMHKHNLRHGMRKKSNETMEQYKNNLTQDLKRTQSQLKEKAGIDCTAVAFPFGLYSKPTIEIIKELGYKSCLTCTEGINKISKNSDLFELKRFNRPQNLTSEQFFKNTVKLKNN